MSEDSIKEVATKWELINATKKGLKGHESGDKPVKVTQVKTQSKTNTTGQDSGSCFKCGAEGHWTKQCTEKPDNLKCSHCSYVEKHNTNDYCKAKQVEWMEKNKNKKSKANQISAKEEKEEDSLDEELANAQQVRAQEDLSSSDEEDLCERHFENQYVASEGDKRVYKDKEGNRFSTEKSSWKGGRRSRT